MDQRALNSDFSRQEETRYTFGCSLFVALLVALCFGLWWAGTEFIYGIHQILHPLPYLSAPSFPWKSMIEFMGVASFGLLVEFSIGKLWQPLQVAIRVLLYLAIFSWISAWSDVQSTGKWHGWRSTFADVYRQREAILITFFMFFVARPPMERWMKKRRQMKNQNALDGLIQD